MFFKSIISDDKQNSVPEWMTRCFSRDYFTPKAILSMRNLLLEICKNVNSIDQNELTVNYNAVTSNISNMVSEKNVNPVALPKGVKGSIQMNDEKQNKFVLPLCDIGLENPKSYICYINAVVQCLMRVDANFTAFYYHASEECAALSASFGDLIKSLGWYINTIFIFDMHDDVNVLVVERKTEEPNLPKSISMENSSFFRECRAKFLTPNVREQFIVPGLYHDAEEYMMMLLDGLRAENQSIVDNTFNINFLESKTCVECNTEELSGSHHIAPYIQLALPADRDIKTVSLLELLSPSEKINFRLTCCDFGKEGLESCTVKKKFISLPNVLVIVLIKYVSPSDITPNLFTIRFFIFHVLWAILVNQPKV